MDLFVSAPLSLSGKPILLENETEIKLHSDTEILLESSNREVLLNDGSLILTNFRLIYVVSSSSTSSRIGWAMVLSCVSKIEDCATMFSRSSRMRIITSQSSKVLSIRFINNHAVKDEFVPLMQKQLNKRSWESSVTSRIISATNESPVFSVSNAGVGGLLRRQERDMTNVDAVTKEALTDLDSLMRSAKDVVSIIERYSAATTSNNNTTSSSSSATADGVNSNTNGEINEMENILQSIGIISPVTKFSAGREYHKELSKQLADLLLHDNVLKRMGSIATLPDIYCLFNRARGTELVSPDDFLKAAEYVGKLNVGLTFKRFSSGVLSIHLDAMNESSTLIQFLRLLEETEFNKNGLSASAVSKRLHISVVVAKEQLLLCEKSGKLCRDESVEGVFFFPNLFATTYYNIYQ